MQSLYKGQVIDNLDSYEYHVPALQVKVLGVEDWLVVGNPHPLEFMPGRDSEEYQLILAAYIRTGKVIVMDYSCINIVSQKGLRRWDSLAQWKYNKVEALAAYLEKLNGLQ